MVCPRMYIHRKSRSMNTFWERVRGPVLVIPLRIGMRKEGKRVINERFV